MKRSNPNKQDMVMLRYAWYFKDDHYLAKVADVQKQAGAELGQAQL